MYRDGDQNFFVGHVYVYDVDLLVITCILSLPVAPELTFLAEGQEVTRFVRRNVGARLPLFCSVNAVPAATFVEIRRNTSGDVLVLNHTALDDSNLQSVQYILSNLMLSDSDDVFSCVANNSVGLRERNFTLVVQGGCMDLNWLFNSVQVKL